MEKVFGKKGLIDHPALIAILEVDDPKYILRRCKENLDTYIRFGGRDEEVVSIIVLLGIHLVRLEELERNTNESH